MTPPHLVESEGERQVADLRFALLYLANLLERSGVLTADSARNVKVAVETNRAAK